MAEFASMIRQRASEVLRQMYQHEATPEIDPILELIGFLLEDGAGGVSPPADSSVTTEQWLTWNELALTRQTELVRTMTSVLERERMELPTELVVMRTWAACLVLSTLESLADQGIDQSQVDAAIHGLEFEKRERSNAGFPYALRVLFASMPAYHYGGDAYSALNFDADLDHLQKVRAEGRFFENLIRSQLLDNPHRALLTVIPDTTLEERERKAELDRLAAIESKLSEDEKARIVARGHPRQHTHRNDQPCGGDVHDETDRLQPVERQRGTIQHGRCRPTPFEQGDVEPGFARRGLRRQRIRPGIEAALADDRARRLGLHAVQAEADWDIRIADHLAQGLQHVRPAAERPLHPERQVVNHLGIEAAPEHLHEQSDRTGAVGGPWKQPARAYERQRGARR